MEISASLWAHVAWKGFYVFTLFYVRVESGSFASAADKEGIVERRRPYCKLVAGLLRDLGVLKCQLGEMAAGCQLLRESAGLYQWIPPPHGTAEKDEQEQQLTVDDVISIAEVRYRSGSRLC